MAKTRAAWHYARWITLPVFLAVAAVVAPTGGAASDSGIMGASPACAYPCNPKPGWWCVDLTGEVPYLTFEEWSGPPDV